MYKIDLSKVKDKDQVYEDLNYMSYENFKEKYDIELLEGENLIEATRQLDSYKFNTEGDTLLLVTPMMNEEDFIAEEPLGTYFSVVVDE